MNERAKWRLYLDAVGPKALPILGHCLSGSVLREVGTTGYSRYLEAALTETGFVELMGADTSVGHALEAIFELLRRSYRCEYVYRSAIASKLFLGRHSPATTTLLPELRVWKSKADVAMFNGTSIAYEIKTELDNLDRLPSQLRDYSAVFDRIFVVTHQEQLDELKPLLPSHVGILILSRALTFRVEREAASNADNVHPRMIVDALRRDEVAEVTRRVVGSVPEATDVALVERCADRLAACAPRQVHDAMVSVLKERMRCTREDLADLPHSLLSAYFETGLRPKVWRAINDRIARTTLGDLTTRVS